jgi:hypothetical protein
MFSFLKKDKTKEVQPQAVIPPSLLAMRETLYTNESLDPLLERLQDGAQSSFPWNTFFAANEALKAGDKEKAIVQLKEIVGTQGGLDTRIRLQAWHTLVSLGEQPVETLRGYTQGVILENHTDKGLEIVAGYSDFSARYWNPAGTGVIWDAREKEMDQLVFNFLSTGFEITKRIGVGLRDMPPVPQKGNIRIFIMAYDGSTVGEGVYQQFNQDKMGNAAITAGYKLMNALIKKHKDKSSVVRYAA